ncbi:MAG: response regulator [Candidatus Cloacimonetes bacterium]|nr:response regulator [Candidatus Cloacimonadota bacterium]
MKHKILIIEDNTDFRNCIMEFLQENGMDSLGGGSLKEAISIYNGNSSEIDLFLIDLKLPDGNGMNFLKDVRKESNTSPAIIMSGIITEDVRRIGRQLGVVEYFEKPFDIYALERAVRKAIQYHSIYTVKEHLVPIQHLSTI